jgi:hypothetical protein
MALNNPNDPPTAYEEQHVHAVYEQIASHFSSTRYKVCLLSFNHIPKTKERPD